MTRRCSQRFSLLCLSSLVLSGATTSYAASDAQTTSDKDAQQTAPSSADTTSSGKPDSSAQTSVALSSSSTTTAPPTGNSDWSMPISVAAFGSYGPTSDYLQGGVGLRAGVHIEGIARLYLGGTASYFFGLKRVESEQLGQPGSSATRRFMMAGVEGGIEFSPLREVTVRPYLGLGLGRALRKDCSGDDSCHSNAAYPLTINPSVLALYDVTSNVFVGADFRYLIATGNSDVSGIVLSGTLGVRF